MSSDVLSRIQPNAMLDKNMMKQMDEVIRNIPPHQLRSPDHNVEGMDPAVSFDPFTHFGRLRDSGQDVVRYIDGKYGDVRVYNVFGRDLTLPNFAVVGYDAIRSMVTDRETFINGGAYGAHGDAQNPGFTFVNELDGAEHKAMRRIFESQVFSRQYLTDLADNSIGPIAEFLTQRIRGMIDAGEQAELCRDLALPLLYMSMARVIGINMADLSYFVGLGDAVFSGPRDYEGAMAAAAELDQYFGKVFEERLAKGDLDKGDLMSLMHNADSDGLRFTPHEVVVYCRFFLPAGIETTWRQTANICHALMMHPDQYQALVQDQSLWPGAIEECLRWMPSGFNVPRTAAKDTVLAGVDIPAGSSLYGIFGVANRDPRIWPDGEKFDIRRARKPHLTFSAGTHTCMGQALARQSFNHVMRALTTNLPDMVLAVDPAELSTSGYTVRGSDGVPVRKA
jgi:cytochrome P450